MRKSLPDRFFKHLCTRKLPNGHLAPSRLFGRIVFKKDGTLRSRHKGRYWASRAIAAQFSQRNLFESALVSQALQEFMEFDDFFASNTWLKDRVELDYDPNELAFVRSRKLSNLLKAFANTYKVVIVVPWITKGGADLVAMNLASEISKQSDASRVLLLVVDFDDYSGLRKFGQRTFDVCFLSDYVHSDQDKLELLKTFLHLKAPNYIVNINSRICWEVFLNFGKSLKVNSKLIAAAFCKDFDDRGFPNGYLEKYFEQSYQVVEKYVTDNKALPSSVASKYSVDEIQSRKFHCLYQPVSIAAKSMYSPEGSVLWSGRFSNQKNIDMLLGIAKLCPQFNFDVYGWGQGVEKNKLLSASRVMKNVRLMGEHNGLEDLRNVKFSAFLFTSRWEGIPNSLLEAAANGLPIISSNVGGICEVVSEDTGWLINGNASDFAAAIEQVKTQPKLAVHKTENMKQLLRRQHSTVSFSSSVAELFI